MRSVPRGVAVLPAALALGCATIVGLVDVPGAGGPGDGGTADSASVVDATDAANAAADAANAGDAANAADVGDLADGAQVEGGAPYAQVVLSDAPLAYWRVDETSGSIAHDATGNGNDAQYFGGVTLGAGGALLGDSDPAATFDGKTGHLDAGDRFAFTGNTPFTLEAWAAPQTLTANYERLFAREPSTTPRNGYLMFLRTGAAADPAAFGFERWSDGGQSSCPSTTTVTWVWHHFVVTFDGATARIYLDGVLSAAQPAAAPLEPTQASLWAGASPWDPSAFFQGSMDELAVYGTALPQARITAHFRASGR